MKDQQKVKKFRLAGRITGDKDTYYEVSKSTVFSFKYRVIILSDNYCLSFLATVQ
jgi:hypothetical protein